MAGFTRVNGDGQYLVGNLYSVYQQKAVVVTVKDASNAAVDLRAVDGPTADQLVSLVVRELQPLMYYTVDDNSGVIHMIVDGHAIDAATLQLRVRHVVAGKLGHAPADNDSTVVVGTAITVA